MDVAFLAADLKAKRLELLSELVPQARLIVLLMNPSNPHPWICEVQEAARANGMQLQSLMAATESEIDTGFATIVQRHADALVVGDDSFFVVGYEQVAALASRHLVPVIAQFREFAAAGGA
jgi:putative ABC transport system substrate-binding protein